MDYTVMQLDFINRPLVKSEVKPRHETPKAGGSSLNILVHADHEAYEAHKDMYKVNLI